MGKITLAAVFVMLLWASCYPLIVLSLPFAPPILTAFLRAAFAGIFLVIIAILVGRPFPNKAKDWLYILAIGLTATSIGFWGMFYAGTLISPGMATVLTNTQPLMASVLGLYFLKEHLNKRSSTAILLGFTGVIVISSDSLITQDATILVGVVYILVAAIGIALSNILLKKLANQVDILYAMGFQLLIGAVPLGLFSFNQNDFQLLHWEQRYILLLTTLAILGTALPFILWFWLMNKAPLYKLNIFSFLTPVFGLYFGMTYFSESLSYLQWAGVFVIGFSLFLMTKSDSIQTNSAPPKASL